MDRNKIYKILSYLSGLAVVTSAVYFFILQYDGYILFWDMSGSFDFRAPFEQYFKLETAYDGLNVGVRNRLPIATLVFLITQVLDLLGFTGQHIPIKVATLLMFAGGYTAFYISFPHLKKYLSTKPLSTHNTAVTYVLLPILSIMYLLIPWYAARTSQLHLFYFSVFYPLGVVTFLRLLETERVSVKYVMLFVFVHFFGLNTPHIVIFMALTYISLFIPFLLRNVHNLQTLKIAFKNLLFAGVLVLVTNLYWLLPYIWVNAPQPGYLVNEYMTQMLSQNMSLENVLIGQGDWYTNQADLNVIDNSESSIIKPIQILGVFSIYFLALYHAISNWRNKYLIGMVVLSIAVIFLISTTTHLQRQIFDTLVYSPFGWVIREPHKLQIIPAFWVFVFFALFVYEALQSKKQSFIINRLLPVVSVIAYFVFVLPINFKYIQYLKPQPINTDLVELYDYLREYDSLSYVHFYPNNEPFALTWGINSFTIADSTEYKFIPYTSPLPPTQISTVVPNQRTFENMLTDFVLRNWDSLNHPESILEWGNIHHIVIRNDGAPILYDQEILQAEVLTPVISHLEESKRFKKVLTNNGYSLYQLQVSNKSSIQITTNRYKTYEDFYILDELPEDVLLNSEISFCDFEKFKSTCGQDDIKVLTRNVRSPDIMESYSHEMSGSQIIPADSLKDYGVNVEWGIASQQDKVNAELHNILRSYGIEAWSFSVHDIVAYSDLNAIEQNHPALLKADEVTCNGKCRIFIKLLESRLGGELDLIINHSTYTLNTLNRSRDRFVWKEMVVGGGQNNYKLSLVARSGFQAVEQIVIIPEEELSGILESTKDKITLTELKNSPNTKSRCEVIEAYFDNALIRNVESTIHCEENAFASISTFSTQGQFLLRDSFLDYSVGNNFLLESGQTEYKLYELSMFDLVSIPLVILSFNFILIGLLLIVRSERIDHILKLP